MASGRGYPRRPDERVSDQADKLSFLSIRSICQQSIALLAGDASCRRDSLRDIQSLFGVAFFMDGLVVIDLQRRFRCVDSVLHLVQRGSVCVLDAGDLDRCIHRLFV